MENIQISQKKLITCVFIYHAKIVGVVLVTRGDENEKLVKIDCT